MKFISCVRKLLCKDVKDKIGSEKISTATKNIISERERGGGEEGGRMGERQVEMTDIPFISAREKYGMIENLCGVNTSKFDNIFLYL